MKLSKIFPDQFKIFKTYLIIIFFSLIAGIYFLEGYITFWKDPKSIEKSKIYKKQTGKEYDTRTKIQAYEDLKKIKKKNNNKSFTKKFHG